MLIVLIVGLTLAVAPGQATRAYAEDGLEATAVQLRTQAAGDVHYIAIFGADTWVNRNGSHHPPASDMTALARVDAANGTVSILTLPRDTKYDNIKSIYPKAKNYKSNAAFRYIFDETINSDWSNYNEAICAGAEAECKVLKDMTGIDVTEYAVVDLYTLQDIVEKLGGIKVDIPVAIGDYVLYSDGKTYAVNDGKTGPFVLNGWDASVAARNRQSYGRWSKTAYPYPYYSIWYKTLKDYKGDYPNLLISKVDANGKSEKFYHFDGDGTRQFLCRRMFASLITTAIDVNKSAWSFVWDQLVQNNLMWTNLSKDDVKTIGEGLAKAKKAEQLNIYGASMVSPVKGRTYTIDGKSQYLIVLEADDIAKKDAAVAEFKAGKPMTSGWGHETIVGAKVVEEVGLPVGSTEVKDGITYKVTSTTAAAVVSVKGAAFITVPNTVDLNGKTYKVTAIQDSAFAPAKGSVKTVAIGANVTSIGAKAFANCTKLTKVTGGAAVKTMGNSAFSGCTALTACAPAASKKLTSIPKCAFKGNKALVSVAVGAAVTSIGEQAFAKCAKLAKVTGGAAVKTIGKYAFSSCKVLSTCKPLSSKKLASLAEGSFNNCKALASVTLGAKVTTIGVKAFTNCTKLKKVTGGTAVKKIGAYAFSGCKKLASCKPLASTKLTAIGDRALKKTALKKITVKSVKLTKKGVKNSLKGSSVKTIKVSVAKSKKKACVKKYKKYFAKKNSGAKTAPKVS